MTSKAEHNLHSMDYAFKLGRHNIVSIYMEFLLTTATDLSLVYKEFF